MLSCLLGKRVRSALITLLACVSQASVGHGFVVLSGDDNATLKGASVATPSVVLQWNGSAPPLEDLEELEGGRWSRLDDTSAMEQIILLALSKWNSVPGSFVKLELSVNRAAVASSEDGQHVITVAADDNATTAAFALPIISEKVISDCDITVGANTTSATSLAYTIIHELGHCLGLGHNHTNYGSIMGYSRSARHLALGADDRAGLIYLYPDPAYLAKPTEPISCGTSPLLPPTPPFGQGLVLLLPCVISVLGLALARRHQPHLVS